MSSRVEGCAACGQFEDECFKNPTAVPTPAPPSPGNIMSS